MFDIGTAGLGLIDYTIFFAVLVAVLVVGIRSGGKVKNLDDYAISREKRFSTPVLAMTLIVSVIGSNTSIGAISEVYNNGIIYLIVALLYTIGKVLVILYATNFIAGRYFGAISLYGIIESEYGLIPARLSAIFSVLLSLVSLAMQIIGMGYVMKIFIGMPFVWGAAISTFVFVMYSSISGIRGVVYTDVLQFFIVLVIFPILLAIIVYNAGSLQNVFASLPEQKTIIFEHPQFQEYVYLILFWSFPFGFLRADSIQRFLMCKDGNELKSMGLSYVLFYVVFSLIVSIIGLSALSLVPGITGKEVLPLLMKNHFPIGLKGLAITAFFAIIMSTADSVLNAATVLIAEVQMGRKKTTPQQNKAIHKMDKKTSEGDETDITWLRISSVVLGTIAFILSLLDFSLIKVMTVASAIAFVAVNIPVFFAPFKERGKGAVNAYTGSAVGGLGAFLTLWLTLGQNKLYMVSFYTTFFAVAGWFIGANFFDKIKTNFWRRMWKTYAPKFNTRPILDSARGHAYFVVFGIVTFSLRYILNVWQPFVPGNIIISIAFTISCSLLLILYFGDKIKIISHKLFIALWLITLFMVLPMYNMIAVLQHPDNMIEIVSLVISVLILNLTLSWRQATLFLMIAFGVSRYLTIKFYHHNDLLLNFEHLTLAAYVTISGIITTMVLKKIYDNVAGEKLQYTDAMACSIAHELKSPIAHGSILLQAHKVRTMEDIEPLLQKMDKTQRKASDVISRTVQLFTRGTSDRIVDEDVNVANLLMLVMVGANYPHKDRERMNIKVNSDFVVRAYPNNLFTIMDNLVRNAYKYALQKKKNAELEIYTNGNQLIFRDSGPGISSYRLLTIFDKGVTYNPAGSGFGLYYCKIEMERLGGNITCESKDGEYTKFTLTFPKKCNTYQTLD